MSSASRATAKIYDVLVPSSTWSVNSIEIQSRGLLAVPFIVRHVAAGTYQVTGLADLEALARPKPLLMQAMGKPCTTR